MELTDLVIVAVTDLMTQCVVTVELDLVVYDVSLRVPGNPIMATTSPYTKYYYGHTMGVGRRIAMEVKKAMEQRKLRNSHLVKLSKIL